MADMISRSEMQSIIDRMQKEHTSKCQKLRLEITTLQQKNTTLDRELANRSPSSETAESTTFHIEAAFDIDMNHSTTSSASLSELQEQLDTDKALHEKELDELRTSLQSKIEDMAEDLMVSESKISSLEKENEDLIALIQQKHAEYELLKSELSVMRPNRSMVRDGPANAHMESGVDLQSAQRSENRPANTTDAYVMQDGYYMPEVGSEDIDGAGDVMKEYLHLTATAAKLKFPHVQMSSNELITKVQYANFADYHELMVQELQKKEQEMLPAADSDSSLLNNEEDVASSISQKIRKISLSRGKIGFKLPKRLSRNRSKSKDKDARK